MELDEECKDCLYNSQLKKVERSQSDRRLTEKFKTEIKELCARPPEKYCAPLLMRDIDGIHKSIFGSNIDYSTEKSLFNKALLAMQDRIACEISADADPLGRAVKYAMAANYLDFARISDLNEDSVNEVIAAADRAEVDAKELNSLKRTLTGAKTLCFLHDNCGEIVLDKILIGTIKTLYPKISVCSVVRGGEIINDATRRDADEVGLGEISKVIDNGTAIPGTYLKEINAETKLALSASDVIISKGLGNLETLYGAGYRAFYMFMCKCNHIAERFGKKLWETALVEESNGR